MRRVLKGSLEWLMVNCGAAAASRLLVASKRPLILAYHNILPEGAPPSGDLSLHLPRSEFARQLDYLAESFEVVCLSRIVDESPGDRPRLAITFDDAYRGAVKLGIHELTERNLPATVFVAPGLLGSPGFWWDQYARPDQGLPDEVRRTGLNDCHGDSNKVATWHAERGMRPLPLPDHYGCVSCGRAEGRLAVLALPSPLTRGPIETSTC